MSKRLLTNDDLASDRFLLPAERNLLANKSRATHIGFSILLKYFQLEGRFPAPPKEISSSAVKYVAYQLDSTAEDWSVYIKHLMIQQVLEEPGWPERMTSRDLAALSPLITQHINPYGRFDLDMETRLPIAA